MTEGDRPSTANSRHDYTQRCWLAQKIFRVHSRTRARACCSTAVPTTVLRSSEMTFGLATPNFHRSFTRFLPLFEQPALLYSTNFPLKFNRVISHTSSKRTLSDSTREIIFSPPFFPPNLDSARLRVPVYVPLYIFSRCPCSTRIERKTNSAETSCCCCVPSVYAGNHERMHERISFTFTRRVSAFLLRRCSMVCAGYVKRNYFPRTML